MIASLPGLFFLLLLILLRRYWPALLHPMSAQARTRHPEVTEVAPVIAGEYLQWAGLLTLNAGLTCWLLEVPPEAGAWGCTVLMVLLIAGARLFTERELAKRFPDL